MLFRPSGVSSSKSSCTRFSNGASFFALIVCPSARWSSSAPSFVVRGLGAPAGRRRRRRRRVRSSDRIAERAARETSFGCYVLRGDACVRSRSCGRGDAASRRRRDRRVCGAVARVSSERAAFRCRARVVGRVCVFRVACDESSCDFARVRPRARARARNTVSVPSSVRFYVRDARETPFRFRVRCGTVSVDAREVVVRRRVSARCDARRRVFRFLPW